LGLCLLGVMALTNSNKHGSTIEYFHMRIEVDSLAMHDDEMDMAWL
jgi:hypothetical protein